MHTRIKCHGLADSINHVNLKFLTSLVLPLLFLLTVAMPQSALAQTTDPPAPCSIEKGTVDDENVFAEDESGTDFKISCLGLPDADAKLTTSINALLDAEEDYEEGESKVVLVVRGDTREKQGITFNSDAATLIFEGAITNDTTVKDDQVVVVETSEAAQNLDVESHADITARGDGRKGLVARNNASAASGNIVVKNYGEILTEGDIFIFDSNTDPSTTPRTDADFLHKSAEGIQVSHGSGATGDLTVVNESGASVTVKGLGARGIAAQNDGTGASTVTNKGTVTTHGGAYEPMTPIDETTDLPFVDADNNPLQVSEAENWIRYAYGVYAGAKAGAASATNAEGGTITTGDPESIKNPGTVEGIRISGTQAHGLRANTEEGGKATVTNAGTITTHGKEAHGMSAMVTSTAKTEAFIAVGVNSGTITTHGDGSKGASIRSDVSSDDTSKVSVDNSGTVTTNGDNAEGIEAVIQYKHDTDSTDAPGTVMATNSGTVTTNGDQTAERLSGAVQATFENLAGTIGKIKNSGNAIVENTGTVNALGDNSAGLRANTFGSGKSMITVTDGKVNAGKAGKAGDPDAEEDPILGKFGVGIYGHADTDSTESEDDDTDVDVMILVTGSSAVIQAYGVAEDDSTTMDFDESKGIAILAETGEENGHSEVTISDGATVQAFSGIEDTKGYAVMFKGGKGTLNLMGGNLIGNIMFTDKDDSLKITKGSIEGDIEFGMGDSDTMTVDVDEDMLFQITGTSTITGLETLTKTGMGTTRFGDVTFEGSMLSLDLEEGALVIAGHLDLTTGQVTVHDAAKLVFEIDSEGGLGRITAESLHFQGDAPAVYAQLSDALTDEELSTAREGLAEETHTPLMVKRLTSGDASNPTSLTELVVKSEIGGGESTDVGTIAYANNVGTAEFTPNKISQIAKVTPPATAPSRGGGGGGSSSGLGLGLLAVLLAVYLGTDLFDTSSFAEEYHFGNPQSAYIASVDERGVLMVQSSSGEPYQLWIRSARTADATSMSGIRNTGVNGSEVGLSLYKSDDFYVNASVAPKLSASVDQLNLAAEGQVYALSSGWRNDRHFAGLRLSHGEFEADSVVNNPIVNSALVSESSIRHTQASFTAGTHWNIGQLRLTPNMSAQIGSVSQKAHIAQSPALEAMVPGYTQDYSSMRVGMNMSSTDWLSFADDAKWKPHLRLDTIHTNSTSVEELTLRQSDKVGALSFTSDAYVQGMPEVVNSLSFGASVKSSKSNNGEWKFGYAGMQADGEYYQAAMMAYKLRF